MQLALARPSGTPLQRSCEKTLAVRYTLLNAMPPPASDWHLFFESANKAEKGRHTCARKRQARSQAGGIIVRGHVGFIQYFTSVAMHARSSNERCRATDFQRLSAPDQPRMSLARRKRAMGGQHRARNCSTVISSPTVCWMQSAARI